jgi:hypothetical protein
VLHKLPREHSKAKRGSVPIDRRVDADGFQCGEQLSLLVVKRAEERLPTQRADIVLGSAATKSQPAIRSNRTSPRLAVARGYVREIRLASTLPVANIKRTIP